ncbi:MAG: leucine-rich repeat domain-containing protein [Simkania sp.]|nr:leucine-rich repeat domain-containing protein [Simkania sp.]
MSYLNRKRIKLGLDPIKNTDKAVNLVELYQVGYAEWERHEQKRNRLILCKRWDVPVESSETPESVTRKLNDWLDTNGETISELDLIYPPLTWLPPEIWKLTNLKKIDLEGHRLISLPSEIGKLTKLEKLNLLSNELKELPEELCQLTNLKELYLAENSLTRLPEGIGQLKNLEWLNISDNKLSELPGGLCQLINLKSLLLGRNSLTRLPEEIEQLKKLTSLDLSSNQFNIWPLKMLKITNPLHRTVQLRGNPIHDRLLMTRKALAQLFRAALIMTNVVMVTLLITRLIPRSQEE